MQTLDKKIKTDAGAFVARYTMKVSFKKEFQRAKLSTGEVVEHWTYRSDLVEEEFRKLKLHFKNPLNGLAWKYKSIRHKCSECRVWDNSLPKESALIFHESNGVIIVQRNREQL